MTSFCLSLDYHMVSLMASELSKLVTLVSLTSYSLLHQQILAFEVVVYSLSAFVPHFQVFLFGMFTVTKRTHLCWISKRLAINGNIVSWSPKSLRMVTTAKKLKDACSLEGKLTNLDSILKSKDITLPTKVHIIKTMIFP